MSANFELTVNIQNKNAKNVVEPRGILLAPAHIKNIDKLIECCKDDVMVFEYDIQWTYTEFMSKLATTLKTIPRTSLELFGWIFHGDIQNIQIVSDQNVSQWQHMYEIIAVIIPHMKPGFNRIDFLACSLTQNPYFEMFKSLMSFETNVTFASSNNLTGNVAESDWILEDGGINLIGTYFNPDINEVLRDYPIELGFITESLFDIVYTIRNPKKLFKGKSGFEIASMVFEIASYIPGPIGFTAGLVGFGLAAAEYSKKVESGNAKAIDHINYTIGTLGTLASCVPGGRMATRLSKIGITKNAKIVKRINGIGSKMNIVVGEFKCMTENITTARSGMTLMIRTLNPRTTNITKFMNLYNKIGALEVLLTNLSDQMKDDEDVEWRMNTRRQEYIEIVSSIAQDDQCILSVNEFAHVIATQYGTCMVNGLPKFKVYGGPLPMDAKGIFVDNETKGVIGIVDTIKINPRTIVYVWPATPAASTPSNIYINDNALDVLTVNVNKPSGLWKVQAHAFDNVGIALIYNALGVSSWCVRNTVINHFGVSKIVLKPKTILKIGNVKKTYDYVNKSNEDMTISVSIGEICSSQVSESE